MNPFKTLLTTLSDCEWQKVTIAFLNSAAKIINNPDTVLVTYGEVFKALEYLAQAGVIELVPDETEPGVHKIRKKSYGN